MTTNLSVIILCDYLYYVRLTSIYNERTGALCTGNKIEIIIK